MVDFYKYCIFLSLGSNLGNKQKNIERAYKEIEKRIGTIVSKSAFYCTQPVGFESENEFVNSVCEVNTSLNAHTVLKETQEIEKEIGRVTKSKNQHYEDRIIDIDLLLFADTIIEEINLIIPHPRLHLRDFVLTPLAEIAPDVIHPVFNKSILELKRELMENACQNKSHK